MPALLQETHDGSPKPWRWRTDLGATQPFWEGWFIGLSGKFLSATGGKLLILAGTDRLDKELMIGQMQGKYQLIVMPEVGHFVHEDAPEKTAVAVRTFLGLVEETKSDADFGDSSWWSSSKGMIEVLSFCHQSLRLSRKSRVVCKPSDRPCTNI